jgi:hypothetical protein
MIDLVVMQFTSCVFFGLQYSQTLKDGVPILYTILRVSFGQSRRRADTHPAAVALAAIAWAEFGEMESCRFWDA